MVIYAPKSNTEVKRILELAEDYDVVHIFSDDEVEEMLRKTSFNIVELMLDISQRHALHDSFKKDENNVAVRIPDEWFTLSEP